MKTLRIKNFKCFEDEEINFSNLTVLAGNNGSGKSTVIQALLIMAQSFNRKDFIHIPKRLYINDYYCELGNAQRLRNYNASQDSIEFIFKDSSTNKVNFICSIDKQDLNILNIDNYEDVDIQLRDETNKSLDFLAFFDFISADRFGPKTFYHTDSNFSRIKVGKYGEYSTLVLDKYKDKVLNINLPTKEDGKSLLSHVNFWLSKIFGYIQIDTKFIKEANVAMLKIKNNPHGDYESPVNMPYGVSYVLPIIVSCLVRNIPKEELFEDSKKEDIQEFDKEMIIIENPEAHLHPAAQSMLGIFLAVMSKKIQIVIETHSEHIINGIRLAVLEKEIVGGKVSINFFQSTNTGKEEKIIQISIDPQSNLSEWPKGFFDQQEKDLATIFKKRANK